MSVLPPHTDRCLDVCSTRMRWCNRLCAKVSMSIHYVVWMTFVTRLRWVSITPFGTPVVPLLYGSSAVSSGSIYTCGTRLPSQRSNSEYDLMGDVEVVAVFSSSNKNTVYNPDIIRGSQKIIRRRNFLFTLTWILRLFTAADKRRGRISLIVKTTVAPQSFRWRSISSASRNDI